MSNPVPSSARTDPNRPIPKAVDDLHFLIRAQYKLVYVVSPEESRVEKWIKELSGDLSADLREKWDVTSWKPRQFITWSCSMGFRSDSMDVPGDVREPIRCLDWIASGLNKDAVIVLRDFHPFFNDPMVARRVRDLVTLFEGENIKRTVVFLSSVVKIPLELEKDIQVIDFDLPDRDTMVAIVREKAFVGARSRRFGANFKAILDDQNRQREIAEAALGLTESEARHVLDKTMVRDKEFSIPRILQEKKHIIRKSGILEFYETEIDMNAVGGLTELKGWLEKRKQSFTPDAQAFGLPEPKGILLIGIPGCGKSLSAKAIAAAWQMPLLRLDVGKVFGSLVGSSEENMRKAIKTSEAVAPAIMWLDELEKGFSGTKSSGSSDGGTTARVFATFLTWLQEKSSPVFVIATANDVSMLPPELLRKGRFDEIFFVDLPNSQEREEIFRIHLKRRGRDASRFKIGKLVQAAAGYSGSEIEEIIVTGLYNAFGDGKAASDVNTDADIDTEGLLKALDEVIPLSQTMRERIGELREWAKSRARMASEPDAQMDDDDDADDQPRLEI